MRAPSASKGSLGGLSDQIIDIDSLSQQQAAQALKDLAANIRRLRQEGTASVD